MDASDSARRAGPSVAVLTAASRSSVASAAPVGRSPVSHPHAQILTGLPDFGHTPPRPVDNRGSQAVDNLAPAHPPDTPPQTPLGDPQDDSPKTSGSIPHIGHIYS
ncbi:hypothetical protein GCM10009536_22500 [Streptomyces thermocarboxydus]